MFRFFLDHNNSVWESQWWCLWMSTLLELSVSLHNLNETPSYQKYHKALKNVCSHWWLLQQNIKRISMMNLTGYWLYYRYQQTNMIRFAILIVQMRFWDHYSNLDVLGIVTKILIHSTTQILLSDTWRRMQSLKIIHEVKRLVSF